MTLDILLMNSNYYFYILECNDATKYYGHTNNLIRRFNDHIRGRVHSTQNRLPIRLVYFEEIKTRSKAFRREMQFKNGRTRKETIERLVSYFPKTKCQGFNSHKQRSNSKKIYT